MAKLQNKSTSSSKSSNSSTSTLGGILGLILVVLGGIFAVLTGGGGSSSSPTTVASAATQRPGTTIVASSAPTTVASAPSTGGSTSNKVQTVKLDKGFGAKKGFWEVYFTAPLNTTNRKEFVGGTDTVVASIIDSATKTLDIAAFEWNNTVISEATLRAVNRGVTVRMVADNEHTVEDDDSTISELEAAGVPIVYDNRSAFMHNKFMIVDSSTVLTGSTNWSMNGVYRNYNNLLVFRGLNQAVSYYQAEFNDMFVNKAFGSKKTGGKTKPFTAPNNTPMEIYFAPKDDVIGKINSYIGQAKSSVRFMAFSFTQDSMAQAMLAAAGRGVTVQGVFEKTGSTTAASELKPLFCAGLDVRQDGYSGIMHHKVVIIDNKIVIAGSFNFSDNAVSSNDENLVIIQDADLAAQYIAEFGRVQNISTAPTTLTCN